MGFDLTEEQVREHNARVRAGRSGVPLPSKPSKCLAPGQTKRGVMNKSESEWSVNLDLRKSAGEIIAWWFEEITFKLANRTHYRPDFFVQMADGSFEVHEVKGRYVRERSKAKFKIAAERFPFIFYLCVKDKGKWTVTKY